MNDHHEHEHERAIARAVDGLSEAPAASPLPTVPPLAGEGEDATLVREYAELLALLPFVDEPALADPALRHELLDRIATTPAAASPASGAATGAAVVSLRERSRRAETPLERPERLGDRRFLALAAMLAVCVLGVLFLIGQTAEQREAIERLQTDALLRSEETRVLTDALSRREDDLRMVSVTAKEMYPIRPVAAADVARPGARAPEGRIYVCGRHQQWYLSLSDLPPAPDGQEYHLWFMTDEGPVDGGVIEVVDPRLVERAAPFMPPGTRSFHITLEARGPHEIPEGEPVLVADRSIKL